jgi:formylglycine-generating enzyme required for sulfatase activity
VERLAIFFGVEATSEIYESWPAQNTAECCGWLGLRDVIPDLDDGDFVFKLAQFEKHSEKVRLNVYTEPSDARVRILNIGPKFYQGMKLSPGEYDLEVSASEYETHREWISLSAGEDKEVTIRLEHSGPEERFTKSLDMEFVYLKPGGFTMGSSESEKGRDDDETQHKVKLSQGFYMGRTEVTVGQFRQFITATGYETEAETDGGADVWTGEERQNLKNGKTSPCMPSCATGAKLPAKRNPSPSTPSSPMNNWQR